MTPTTVIAVQAAVTAFGCYLLGGLWTASTLEIVVKKWDRDAQASADPAVLDAVSRVRRLAPRWRRFALVSVAYPWLLYRVIRGSRRAGR